MKETTSSILQRTCCKCSQHNQKRNALQIEKKHLQIKKTLSSIWQPTRCRCSQHNQKRNVLQIKCIWLCCEHLQCVSLFVCVVSICPICCQNENVFLICWCFFYLHVFSEVAYFICKYICICLCCEHLPHLLSKWKCFLDLLVLFLFACFFLKLHTSYANTYVFDSFDAPEAQSAL